MKAVEYLKNVGIDTLLAECNYNLKVLKSHIMREYNITEPSKVRYAMTLVKKRLKQIIQENGTNFSRKDSIRNRLKEEFANE